MATSIVTYLGELRTRAVHVASNSIIITDAPTDNHGKGEAFSPTDLVATAVGCCMLTIMGIKARELEVDMEGATIAITKIMGTEPRRIVEIQINFVCRGKALGPKERSILENAAKTCPVIHSLHPDIKKTIFFEWN